MKKASYTDPVSGAVYIYLEIPEADYWSIQSSYLADQKSGSAEVRRYLRRQVPGTYYHEWAHLLQVADYPLLLLRAARQTHTLFAYFATLNRSAPIQLPLTANLGERYHWSGLIETVPVRMTIDGSGVTTRPTAPGSLRRGMIREIDFVEEDATILQYRVEIGSRGTGKGYRRWLSESPHYSSLFYYLADLFSDNAAYDLLPIISRVAFSCTRPLEAFAAILTDLVRDGVELFTDDFPDPEWDRWVVDYFLSRILDRFGIVDESSLDITKVALDDTVGVITDDQKSGIEGKFSSLPAAQFASRSRKGSGVLRATLYSPYEYIHRGGAGWNEELNGYEPPWLVVTLIGQSSRSETTYFLATEGAKSRSGGIDFAEGGVAARSSQVAMELLIRKQLLDVALGSREPLTTCTHAECPYNSKGICEGWFEIPENFSDCGFPGWLKNASGLEIDSSGTTMIRGDGQ